MMKIYLYMCQFVLVASLALFATCDPSTSKSPSALIGILAVFGSNSLSNDTNLPSNPTDPPIPPLDSTPTPPAPSSDACVLGTDAFYVNGDSGNDSNSGTKVSPLQTIQKAMELASAGNAICVTYQSGGNSYNEENVTLLGKSGVSILGGYSNSWVRDEIQNPTKWKMNRIGIMFSNLNGDVEISGFDMRSKNPTSPNESSYGIFVTSGTAKLTIKNVILVAGSVPQLKDTNPGSSIGILITGLSKLTIANSEVRAGNAASGADGTNGANGVAGGNGGNGLNGSNDSASVNALGGAGGLHPSISALNGYSGGRGGKGAENGISGLGPCGGLGGPINNTVNYVLNPGLAPSCEVENGNSGNSGLVQSNPIGTFSPYYNALNGYDGEDGTNGTPGSGGGGGGGQACTFCANGTGNGGGGGGAAGSKGTKGTGSQGGASSFAVVLRSINEVTLISSRFVAGNAGNGGIAGNGGEGGAGGLKGTGASTGIGEVGKGGDGAPGGKGGDGGDGSAGAGGSSVALVLQSVTSFSANQNAFQTGNAGNGGSARNSFSGNGGHSIGVYSLNGNSYIFSNSEYNLGNEGYSGAVTGTGSAGSIGRKANVSW